MDRKRIEGKNFDEERALYNETHADVLCCTFAGPADGESVLKEARDITVNECTFSLRYPLWHVVDFKVSNVTMDDKTRAPIWYAKHGVLRDCEIYGVKAVRDIHGKMISFVRNGKEHSITEKRYRLYTGFILFTNPVRVFFKKMWVRTKRLGKKILRRK